MCYIVQFVYMICFLNHPSHHLLIEFIPSKQNIFEVNTEKKLLEISVFEFEFTLSFFFIVFLFNSEHVQIITPDFPVFL